MGLTLLNPGTLATVQDSGRHGWQHLGLGPSGALDPWSLAQGNLLVGNPPGTAALELNLSGGRLRLEQDCLLALSGAEAEAWLDEHPLPMLSPALARAGTELRLGRFRRGARLYVCVAGGIATPPLLGSRSTHLSAGLGEALRSDTRLPLGVAPLDVFPALWEQWRASEGIVVANWWAEGLWARWRQSRLRLRVLAGPAWSSLDADSLTALDSGDFSLSQSADRMGARLNGPTLALLDGSSHRSGPVTCGSLQLPANGQLIMLLAERQTTGGYPRIADVISADRPLMAQLRPGEAFGWELVDSAQAHAALRRRVQLLWRLGVGLKSRKRA